MAKVQLELPPKLIPVFTGKADVRAAHGGRGSAKTRTFAKMTAIRAYMWDMAGREGIILCLRQFMNSLDDSSLEEIKAAIRSEPWLEPHFEIGDKFIRTKSGRIGYRFAGLDRSIESIKSKSRILLGWVDEAEPVTEEGWQILIPTLREEDSELWATWNPRGKTAAVEGRFRHSKDPLVKCAEMNWRDNPWFPAKLERDRQRDLNERPDQYEHIWEGGYRTVFAGAYYAKQLSEAKAQGRIGRVSADPLMTYRAVFDIGGTGAKADAASIWIQQWIGREIRQLNYYEAKGQPLATHLNWMRQNGYTKDNTTIILPHDGVAGDKVYDVSYESACRDAGYEVIVIPNQGKGAAGLRIEAARRLFPAMWFNAETTEAGRDAIGAYHAKIDEQRGVDLGPDHDWSSHGADAFGLACVAYEMPQPGRNTAWEQPNTKWVA